MYTALLSYVKSAIVSHGISITNLALQRVFVILILELVRLILFRSCLGEEDSPMRAPHAMDSSINDHAKKKFRHNSTPTVTFYFFV